MPRQLIGMPNIQEVTSMNDDLYIFDIKYDKDVEMFTHPCKTDYYFALFCKSGDVNVEINLKNYHIRENMMLISSPGSILRLSGYDADRKNVPQFLILVISHEFLSGFSVDVGKIFERRLSFFSDPVMQLSGKELEFCFEYMDLIQKVVSGDDFPNRRESVGSLVVSLFYLFAGMVDSARTQEHVPAKASRTGIIFEQFMSLVSEYHLKERKTSFYAEKMRLTPKYLSKLIKRASGRSAPEWIDSFVILEAKNLLKYTGLSVKEIVYRLNFPNSSVFYKFFRNHTGMTPTEYRDS